MDPRDYCFTSSFTLGAPRAQVHALLVDLELYGTWWPQVRAVGKIDDDNALVVCRAPMFVAASYVARPLMVWNHHRMMRGAERGLQRRLEQARQPSAVTAAS